MISRKSTTQGWVATGVVLGSLLLAGCSTPEAASEAPAESSSQQGTESSAGSSATGSGTGSATSSAPESAEASGDQSAAPAQELGNLGERPLPTVAEDVTVTFNSVVADEEAMTVTFGVTNNEDSATTNVSSAFANGISDAEGGEHNPDLNSVDGVTVVTSEPKRYLVGRSENGLCACSSNLPTSIAPGKTMTFTATFAAPPAEVDTVDVTIPQVGAFEGVELVRG